MLQAGSLTTRTEQGGVCSTLFVTLPIIKHLIDSRTDWKTKKSENNLLTARELTESLAKRYDTNNLTMD
ncbi:MAG: hypothetical protein HKP41_07120 [Desulfobacterales bacterium]|nr:hypothetical protein [Deltaproteobacteria bacterium]MBT8361053.1 hypothetical protein [Deltaproteobacteria bacterium]NNK94106.1 hypothetical protein [Desulfobacterales bacterium]